MPDKASDMAIYHLGVVLGNADALQHSLLFLAAHDDDCKRLRELIGAAKKAATALGVTLWDDEEDDA